MKYIYIYNGLRSIYPGIFNTTRLLPIFSRENLNKKFSTRDAHGSIIGLYFISFGNGRINLEANLNLHCAAPIICFYRKMSQGFFFFSKVSSLLTLSIYSLFPSTAICEYRKTVNLVRQYFNNDNKQFIIIAIFKAHWHRAFSYFLLRTFWLMRTSTMLLSICDFQ